MVLVAVGVLVVVLLALSALTGMGARRRGVGLAAAVVAGAAFPVTWAVWYVRDQHPYRRVPLARAS